MVKQGARSQTGKGKGKADAAPKKRKRVEPRSDSEDDDGGAPRAKAGREERRGETRPRAHHAGEGARANAGGMAPGDDAEADGMEAAASNSVPGSTLKGTKTADRDAVQSQIYTQLPPAATGAAAAPDVRRSDGDGARRESSVGSGDDIIDVDDFVGGSSYKSKAPVPDAGREEAFMLRRKHAMSKKAIERERLEREAAQVMLRRDSINDPAVFARMIVWQEGRWSKSKEGFVIKKTFALDDGEEVSAQMVHERACSALAFWTQTKVDECDKTVAREHCSAMHAGTINKAVAIMGEDHIHRFLADPDDARTQWWLCAVSTACDLNLFGTQVNSCACVRAWAHNTIVYT